MLFFTLFEFAFFIYALLKPKENYEISTPYVELSTQLNQIPWDEFERLCMKIFKAQGWSVKGNDKKGADGGIDIWVKKGKVEAIVQCKRYENSSVGVKVVREMFGLLHEHNVQRAYIMTTSYFTKDAIKFAEDKPIGLIDKEIIEKMVDF